LERLKLLRSSSADTAAIFLLRKSLQDRTSLVVAEAAKTAAELHIVELIPDLLAAYARLFENPAKADPKCWGKTAIVRALTTMDFSESLPYLRGSTHVQMEPVWGGQEDAAGPLRSNCILALPQCTDLRRSDVFRCLVNALTDPLDPVRLEAVRTIEQMNGDEASLLLRLKARIGDRRAAVTGRVFDAILNLESEKGLVFVEEFLKSADVEVRDEAALAIGGWRHPGAVQILIAAWQQTMDRSFRSTLLRAISSSREESGLEFLLYLVREGPGPHATSALEALELHTGSPEIQSRIDLAKDLRLRNGTV
jgi:HEAT repeat protein